MSNSIAAAKSRLYFTDGTGRDTYIGFNHGGNTVPYSPFPSMHGGSFNLVSSH